MKKTDFLSVRNVEKRGGLVQLRRNLADELVGSQTLAHGYFEFLRDGLAYDPRNFDWRLLMVGRQVEITFVNGGALHIRGELICVSEHPFGKLLVTLVVPGQNNELRTKFSCPHCGHRRINAKLPRLVGGGGDDAPAFTADGNGLAAQPRIPRLLHGGEEGVGIEMSDGFALHDGKILA